jgi:hypothetical protein
VFCVVTLKVAVAPTSAVTRGAVIEASGGGTYGPSLQIGGPQGGKPRLPPPLPTMATSPNNEMAASNAARTPVRSL